ncbi:type I-B CRISPR-associated protein Cas8b1/Cst1 [Candidatus Chlorohelix sp.]|uniref:type I-B CRISPR-associated protein Cas8b1/Cst1 n=1 Tax=Candidatus Chlorohelix sp. TaxID=3139201 RepID=UPI003043CD90
MNPSDNAGFHWTGHPFIDFGVETLCIKCGAATPEELTIEQVTEFAEEVAPLYLNKPEPFKSVMQAFGINFLNTSWTREQQLDNVKKYLLAFKETPNPELPMCAFFKSPSSIVVARDAFPMLMGRGGINFYPHGQSGIPVSGQALTAIQAVIFGALRSQGKLLVLEADDPNLRREVIWNWVDIIRKRIDLSKQGKEAHDLAAPKTTLINTLQNIESTRNQIKGGVARYEGGARLYLFNNSGQGPSLEIIALPTSILAFIQNAQRPEYIHGWNEIRRRGWLLPKAKKGDAIVPEDYEPDQTQRMGLFNRFFTDLFNLPEGTARFIRSYFLGTQRALAEKSPQWEDKRKLFGNEQIKAIWNLTELFLEEVLEVQNERIENIKELAEALAVIVNDDAPRYKRFLQVKRNWGEIRRFLIQINRRETEKKQEPKPILKLDQFLSVFEINEDNEYVDWGVAWDLLVIRLMEVLHEKYDFYNKHPDAIFSAADEIEETQEMAEARN